MLSGFGIDMEHHFFLLKWHITLYYKMHLWVCCHKDYIWNLYFNISMNKVSSRLGWLPLPPKSADHSVWQCICWIQVLIRLSLSGQSIYIFPTSGSCCFRFYSLNRASVWEVNFPCPSSIEEPLRKRVVWRGPCSQVGLFLGGSARINME